MNKIIVDGNGDWVADASRAVDPRRSAQGYADRRGDPVWLTSKEDGEGEGERFDPVQITDTDIGHLRDDACAAGDLAQVALCDWALGREGAAVDALEGATRADARFECERVIREAF